MCPLPLHRRSRSAEIPAAKADRGLSPRSGTCAALGHVVSDRRPNLRSLHDDESGAAFVEYVVVLLLIGTVASIATYSLGRPFVDYYRFAQLIVSMPFP